MIKELVRTGHDINAKKATFRVEGDTPLHFAVKYGQKEAIKILVGLGARINEKNKSGSTPLIDAVTESKQEDVVALLLDLGAKIDSRSKAGKTALDWAAFDGNLALVKLLLNRGAIPNVGTEGRRTSPVAECAHNGNTEILKLLIAAGADVNAPQYGDVPISTAALRKHSEFVKLLIEAKANVNHQEESGFTTLMSAVAGGQLEIVKMLLEAGAKIDIADRAMRRTALDIALDRKKTLIAEYLLSLGAKRAEELSETELKLPEKPGTFWQLNDGVVFEVTIDPWPPKEGVSILKAEITENDYEQNFDGKIEFCLGEAVETSGDWKSMTKIKKDEDGSVHFSNSITLKKGMTQVQFRIRNEGDKEFTDVECWKVAVVASDA